MPVHEEINAEGTIKETLPRIAVAMGDPVGIGPEIVVKALSEPEIYQRCNPVVIGDATVLAEAPGWRNGEPQIDRINDIEEARPKAGALQVIDLANVCARQGKPEARAENGQAMVEYLNRGVELARLGQVEAVVFAPLNKAAMKKAGFNYPDEYEYFAKIFNIDDYSVIQVSPSLVLASVTLHASIREMPDMITRERIISTLRHAARAARAAGIERPRIGVAALNPHAGEGGTLGTEERDIIGPAVEQARSEGIDAHGPFPADSFFMTIKDAAYDVYVGMYHDQGRIAIKLLDFGRATTMTEGLPVLFATVAHGTAYDIAGKGVARHQNLVETIKIAARRAIARRDE